MYEPEVRGEVSQGDVFDTLPLAYVEGEAAWTRTRVVRAILLTYDCEYDKPSTHFVLIAEVLPLSEVAPGGQGNIRRNRVASAFYLAPHLNFAEAYVDFRSVGRVDKALVAAAAQAGRRIASLTDEAQLALQEQLSGFFGYGRQS